MLAPGGVRCAARRLLRAPEPRASPPCARSVSSASASASPSLPAALLFDCDGVLCDTERDGHRPTFNAAFAAAGLSCAWDEDEYGELLKTGGGKERMTLYFSRHPEREPWASRPDAAARAAFVAALHAAKTRLFVQLVDAGGLRLRPGVARLVGEALAAGVPLAVCSTSNEQAVRGIVRLLGPAAEARIRVFAGDVVARKKPDPSVYLLAARELGVDPARCCVVEDSHIGLTAAKAAGMRCVVTTNGYTRDEDFGAADRVYDEIGDAGAERFSLADLAALAAQPVAGR